jgi:hypothetical protein
MVTATSDSTGLPIRTKAKTDSYDAGWEALFNRSPVPLGEDTRPKDAVKRGLSSACVEEEWDCRK